MFAASSANADVGAQTDFASIAITPGTRQPGVQPGWQTIYDYSGGDLLPPGTRIAATGKWIEPVTRRDKSGVTFAFPVLPDQPQSAQELNVAFAVDLPLANYPTRATIHYTSFRDQAAHIPSASWSPFQLTTADVNTRPLSGSLRGLAPGDETKLPVHLTGENTVVFSCNGPGQTTAMINGRDASILLGRGGHSIGDAMPEPGAMLLPGVAMTNKFLQQPDDKGDWFELNSMKIEQLRPPLEQSAVAAVDLKVPGIQPIRVTIEITNDRNESQGYLLRDAEVSPGSYRLYWDGINQKQGLPKNTDWIPAGTYIFHLTTGKTAVHYAGEINNSAPKFNRETYAMVNCTALASTPPGTTLDPVWNWNTTADKRKLNVADSVQLLCVNYDARYGQWVGSDGTVLFTKTGANEIQHGRSLALTPPDPTDPANPQKQFYFASRTISNGNIVTSCSLPAHGQKPVAKVLTSPDWNRPAAGFLPYEVHIGRLPYMDGPQHFLLFQMSREAKNNDLHAEWIFRNVRLYEEGDSNPQPVLFDLSRFTSRLKPRQVKGNTIVPIAPNTVTVEDDGHSVHVKNSGSINYPLDYKITPHTILAFDLNVLDKSNIGPGNGIGLDEQPLDAFPTNQGRFLNFMTYIDPNRFGFYQPSLGGYNYPFYKANTLYTDTVTLPPPGAPADPETYFLWQPGFYGVNISEDGKFLFACNNADNRLEVRDISTDGRLVAKVPVNDPMYAALLPEGASGEAKGTRLIYLTSPKEGVLRITWTLADNSFSKPIVIIPASEFAYPRGIAYSAAGNRLFVCDTFNLDHSKVANQIVVIDPQTGKIVSRFGKPGGVDPHTGGAITDDVFTCPLTIAADSKGALWINDYYSCEVRKYDFDARLNALTLERRVLGSNPTNTSHFYWMPDDPPTTVWTMADFFVRTESQIDSEGRFTNPRTTSAVYHPADYGLRPYAHFSKIGAHTYGIFYSEIFEEVGDGWVPRFKFGTDAGRVARDAGLLAAPGQPPTDLDKAITAAGDLNWQTRPWAWSDLNGNGKIDYSASQPEFQIAFNSSIEFDGYIPPTGCLRSPDGAFVRTAKGGLVVIPPKMLNGQMFYTWENAKLIPRNDPSPASDVLAQDGRYYALTSSTQRHDMGEKVVSKISCYDESGKLLWTRDQNAFSLVCLQSLGDGMISIMDRGSGNTEGPVLIRTSNGDLVSQVFCQEAGDCWSNGALRSDADTAYIGMVQAYKITGLRTIKTATVTVPLPAGGS